MPQFLTALLSDVLGFVLFCFLRHSGWPRTTYVAQLGLIFKLILRHPSISSVPIFCYACVLVCVFVSMWIYGRIYGHHGGQRCHFQKCHLILFFLFLCRRPALTKLIRFRVGSMKIRIIRQKEQRYSRNNRQKHRTASGGTLIEH